MSTTAAMPLRHCHSVQSEQNHQQQQQQQQHKRIVDRYYSSFNTKTTKNGGSRNGQKAAAAAVVSPPALMMPSSPDFSTARHGNSNSNICWCCIRRPGKAMPSPPPSAAALGAPVMTMGGPGTRTQQPNGTPIELSALKLATGRQGEQQKKKTRSSTFCTASAASRGIFPRLHRSLSSQQQHKVRTNAPPALPPLDLRSLDAADGTPSNTTDYLEVGRAEGGWIRDADFWKRQQEFWRVQQQNNHLAKNVVEHVNGAMELEEEEGGNREQQLTMETARTSRTDDIVHYPSMDTLIDEILSADGAMWNGSNDSKQYFNCARGANDRKSARKSWLKSGAEIGCELEAVVPTNPSPTCSGSSSSSSPPAVTTNDGIVASAFPPAVFFTSSGGGMFGPRGGGDAGCAAVTARQTAAVAVALPRPHPLRALPALTQSLFDVITVTYVWIASSLVLLIQWFM
ncbi:hypothetical protein GPALN_014658 [Globodera pallida]|nr:hypothetical protein GPALN_014658 [Globodera pallida]